MEIEKVIRRVSYNDLKTLIQNTFVPPKKTISLIVFQNYNLFAGRLLGTSMRKRVLETIYAY